MKKILFAITLFCTLFINVNASSVGVSLSCKDRIKSSSQVSCDIYVTPTSTAINGFQLNYSFTNATFSSFTLNSNLFTKYNSNVEKGIVLQANSTISTKSKVGTLTFKSGSTGKVVVTFSNIQSSQSGNTIKTPSFSKTFTIMGKESTLTNLTLSNALLTPSFDPNVKIYKATVNQSTTTITATKKDNYASVSGVGKKTVNYGENTYNIVVKSEDGSTSTTYKIIITRPDTREKINTLSQISLSTGTLSPSFNPSTTTYNVNLPSETSKITITAKKDGEKSTFVKGYAGGTYNLNFGNNKIEIKVKSESGLLKTYTINVNRKDNRSNNNYLKTLSVTNTQLTFDKNELNYQLIVKNKFDKVTIDATAEDQKAKINGLGEINLKEGVNEHKVLVSAENGEIRTYILSIKRLTKEEELSSNTYLKDLKIGNHAINFDKNKISYIVNIKDEKSLQIDTVVEDETSIVDISGNENLTEGSIITLKVTSTDGSTKDYVINVLKDNNALSIKMLILGFVFGAVFTLIIMVIYLKVTNKKTN